MGNEDLLKQVTAKAQIWLGDGYDEETKAAVRAMLDNEDKTDLIEAFYKDLEFGTGGLRGIMGAGTNRMNIYTVGAATQGLSNYLKKAFADLPLLGQFDIFRFRLLKTSFQTKLKNCLMEM